MEMSYNQDVVLLCTIIFVADVLLFVNYFSDSEPPEPPLPSNDFRRMVHGLTAVKEKPKFPKREGSCSLAILLSRPMLLP